MSFKLPELSYSYSALEPQIDTETMKFHHDFHHRAYVNKLNKALESFPSFQLKTIESLLTHIDELPQEVQKSVVNFGGGHFNHSLLWEVMSPSKSVRPKGKFSDSLEEQFGGFKEFKTEFTKEAMGVFGSGYVWLCLTASQELVLRRTENQDCPLSVGLKPIFLMDLWEHAHYLKYQNRRGDYIDAFWKVVNWDKVASLWDHYCKLLQSATGIEKKKDPRFNSLYQPGVSQLGF